MKNCVKLTQFGIKKKRVLNIFFFKFENYFFYFFFFKLKYLKHVFFNSEIASIFLYNTNYFLY